MPLTAPRPSYLHPRLGEHFADRTTDLFCCGAASSQVDAHAQFSARLRKRPKGVLLGAMPSPNGAVSRLGIGRMLTPYVANGMPVRSDSIGMPRQPTSFTSASIGCSTPASTWQRSCHRAAV